MKLHNSSLSLAGWLLITTLLAASAPVHAAVQVSGNLQYERLEASSCLSLRDPDSVPIRYADIEIQSEGGVALAVSSTSFDGSFDVHVAALNPGDDFTLLVWAKTSSVVVLNEVGGRFGASQSFQTSDSTTDVGTMTLRTTNVSELLLGAFSTMDSVIAANHYARDRGAILDGQVELYLYDDEARGSYYANDGKTIHLFYEPGSTASLHEYGHYVDDALSPYTSAAGLMDHYVCSEYSSDGEGVFGEGWAHYFSLAVRNQSFRYPRYGVEGCSACGVGCDYEEGDCDLRSPYVEGNAAFVLWDLFDAANEGHDAVSSEEQKIWDTMEAFQESNPTLIGFLQAYAATAANPIICRYADYSCALLESLTISGPEWVNEGSTASYEATAGWSDGSSWPVTSAADWAEESESAWISESGLFTASAVSTDEIVTLASSFTSNGVTRSDTYSVKIVNDTPALSALTVSGPASVYENSQSSYTATATWSDGSTSTVTTVTVWSENSLYASIDSNGVLTTGGVSSDQSATITASYTAQGVTRSDTHSVAILDQSATLSSLVVDGPTAVDESSSASYSATASWDDGSTSTVTSNASWSENSAYASISSSGVLTTSSVSSGETLTITASYTAQGVTRSDILDVTVLDESPTLSSLTVTGPTSVDESSSASYEATAYWGDGSTSTVTSSTSWSENSAYASISSSGVLTTSSVSSDESVTITASFTAGGITRSDTHAVTIVDTDGSCTPPPAPTASSPSTNSSGWFYEVSWTATSPEDAYEIQEALNSSFSGASNFEDSGPSRYFSHSETSDTTYYYRVRARATCGGTSTFSDWSNTTSTLVKAADCTDDAYEPDDSCGNGRTSLVGSFETHRHCDPDWSSFDPIAGATYEITTSNLSGGADTILQLYEETCSSLLAEDDDMGFEQSASRIEWTAQNSAPLNVGALEFSEYKDGQSYELKIRCLNGCPAVEEPAFFSWVERQTCHGNSPALLVQWTPAPNATSYTVERLDGGYTATVDPALDGLAHLVTQGLEYGRSYDFRVLGHDGAASTSSQIVTGYVVNQECKVAGQPGSPPGPFIAWLGPAVCDNGTPSVEINWSKSGGAQAYTLTRYAEPGGTGRTVTGLQETSYVDSVEIAAGLTHAYVLKAFNASGEERAQYTLDFYPPPDLCDPTGLPGSFELTAGSPLCLDGEPAVEVGWTESSGAEYYSVNTLANSQFTGGGSGPNDFSGIVTTALRPGAVHEIFSVSKKVEPDTDVRRFSNSVHFDLAADVCPFSPLLPGAYTHAPAGVTGSSAIFQSSVRPEGSRTSAHFEWGKTTSYGNSTPDLAVGDNGYTYLQPSVEITGLVCETQYHYRAVAQNVAGTSFGSDVSFTTGTCPSCGVNDLVLSNLGVWDLQSHRACNSITAGPTVVVYDGGDLILTAPTTILGDGFSIQTGGSLKAGPPVE